MSELVWIIGGKVVTGQTHSTRKESYACDNFSTTDLKRTGPRSSQRLCVAKSATNRISHDRVHISSIACFQRVVVLYTMTDHKYKKYFGV
jgi:hypothetical protein